MFFYTLNGHAVTSTGALEHVTVEEIAVQLGRIPRWCGATNQFVSVLHHLLFCARVAEERGHRLDGVISALCHDFHEAFTGDIPVPFLSRQNKILQDKLDKRIFAVLGVPWVGYEKISKVDTSVRVAEAYEFCSSEMYQHCAIEWGDAEGRVIGSIRDEFDRTGDTTSGLEAYGVRRFLDRYYNLMHRFSL